MNHSQDYHDHMFDPGPLESKQYSLDELIDFCGKEIEHGKQLNVLFGVKSGDKEDVWIRKMEQIKEVLHSI